MLPAACMGKELSDQVFQLPARLFHDSILAIDDDAHATQVANLGATDDEGINVEAATSESARDTGQDTRLILDEAIEDMSESRSDSVRIRACDRVTVASTF